MTQLAYSYDKLRTSMRYWLLGRSYFKAHEAMELGLQYHTGTRKDGKTPEFFHQMFQAQFCRTLEPSLIDPEGTLITIFLHDIVEDHEYPLAEIAQYFGDEVAASVELMTNQELGRKKSKPDYYAAMQDDPRASIAKGIDRSHNFQSMPGVFSAQKQRSYIEETREFILPMLKAARKRFPAQEPAYQNVKHMLLTQAELIEMSIKREFQ